MKRFLTIFTLFFALLPLSAQVATVEVSRAYDVNLDGISKPEIPTAVDDSLHRFDVHFDYSIFNRPYGDLYDFTPYESIQLATVGANRTPYVFLRAGTQYATGERGWMPAGELHVQSKPRKGFCSGLYARHNSFFGDLGRQWDDYPTLHADRMQNTVGGDMTYDWSTGELMADIKYNHDSYIHTRHSAEGASASPKARHLNQSLKASVNMNSAHKEADMVYYDVTLAYRLTRKNYALDFLDGNHFDGGQIGEGMLTLKGYVGASFDIHRIYIDMNIEHASYSGLRDFAAGIVEFSPLYQFRRKWVQAKLGVKFGTRYGHEGAIPVEDADLTPRTTIYPDIDARFTLIDKSLWAHAVLSGGNDLNTLSRMVDDCPLIYPASRMEFGRRPLDATLSLEGVIGGRLGLNLETNYRITRNKMMFVPLYDGTSLSQMTTSYRDINQYSIQVEAFWKSQELTVGGRLRYAGYHDPDDHSVITEMPVWTGYTFLRYNFRERIIAQVECNYRSETSGYAYFAVKSATDNGETSVKIYRGESALNYEVPEIVDIDLNVTYLINSHFSVYAKLGNVLNGRNEYMPLYVEPGINFGGGVCMNF